MVPTPGCTTGAFTASSWAIQARSRAVSAPAVGGALSSAVMRPAVSVTTIGMPSERTCRARSSSASVAASGPGSFSPANTRPRSALVWRASSRRCRATIHPYPTVIPPSISASPTTTGGPARRSAPLRATGWHEALRPEVGDERPRNGYGPVGLLMRFEQGGDGARQRHARGVERMDELRLRPRPRAVPDVGAPRLKIREAARARDFQPLPHAGSPDLEVVLLGRGEEVRPRGLGSRRGAMAGSLELEQLHGFSGAARQHPAPLWGGGEAGVRPYAQRLGRGAAAHHRRPARNASAGRWVRDRSAGARPLPRVGAPRAIRWRVTARCAARVLPSSSDWR